jgi:predicted restriction endonuclease
VRKSHLELRKLRNLKNKKIKKISKIKKFALYSFFNTVFRKNCTALSQSECTICIID